jgi:hypothetical protein
MKAKTLVVCVLTASALPLAPALAQQGPQPSGPQGTGSYGAPNAAAAVPQTVSPTDHGAYERDQQRGDMRRPMRERGMYDGPSWETNPPAPAQ